MSTFLDDLPGIRELQWEDGPPLPQRSLLAFVGAVTVQDNEANGSTDVIFGAPMAAGETEGVAVTANLASITNAIASGPLENASLVRIVADALHTVHGLLPTARPRLVFVNIGTVAINFAHNSPGALSADHRLLCPNGVDYTLDGNRCVEVVRDPVDNRWRIVA